MNTTENTCTTPLPAGHSYADTIAAVMAKPIWSPLDLSLISDLPISTLDQVLEEVPAPFFTLGRRKRIFQTDALEWLRTVAARHPWTRRRNNRTIQK